jgi:hypothetical protein
LRALAHAVDEADELLFALRRGADDDQQALRVVFQAGSSDQASLSRPIVEAERPPASLPSKARSASSKSPVETPLR